MLRQRFDQQAARAGILRAAWVGVGLVSGLTSGRVQAATAQDQQLSLASSGAIKLVVRAEGWLRVGQPALLAAGLPATVDPARLQLFADGVEQAVLVTGNGDATFGADEAIEFYGVGRDTLWSGARTYWLVAGPSPSGARVPLQAPAAGSPAPSSFLRDARVVEHKNYVSSILNGDTTNFFGDAVGSTPLTKTLAAPHLDAAGAGATVLRVSLQGATATPHQVDVSFNGQLLGTASLGQRVGATFSFSATNVVEGANLVSLVSHGSTDLSVLASLTLSYPHTFAADADALAFTAPAGTRVSVTGFSSPGVRVVDVTDPSRPVELAVTATAAGATTTARVDTPAGTGARKLTAFLAANVAAPAAVSADTPSSWAASHEGELVIISHASFMDALAPLVARRRQEGWTVQLVDVQDVYDERGGGDKTPFAIRDFLQAARASWRIPPRFVLLVGDATFDSRNFLGLGDFDLVPTKLIDTTTMETASDDWFVDADRDGVPEMAIGRIPARTVAQATTVVGKTLGWAGAADLPRGGLFVTDINGTDLDFETPSAVAETKVADLMPVERFRRSDAANTSAALLTKLDAGPFLVNYLGHGSVEVWDNLLTSAQATALTNDHASIYVVMNCLNGFFHDLYTTSLAESLLEAPQGGAVAVWASSTLADFTPQPAYNQEFLMHLGRTSLGEAALDAKASIDDLESRRTWLLFGDPTLLGKPTGATNDGLGAMDAGATEAGVDAGASSDAATNADGANRADGPVTADAGTGADAGAGADAASSDAATADAAGSNDGAGGTNGKAPKSGDGCGCALDASSSSGAGALGLLLLACAGAVRRRERRGRGAPRRWFAWLAVGIAWLALAPAAQASYGFRKALTIDRTRIGVTGGSTTLSNYPLLISTTDAALKSAGNGGNVQSSSGYDIAFKGADTTTCGGPSTCTFNYEIEKYDATTGQVIAWVQIPVLKTTANTTNTVIYLNYGDATVTTPTQNVNGTWDTNFRGVWHLNQDPTMTTMTDSTSTPANGTSSGAPAAAAATGLVGAGFSMSSATGAAYLDYRSTKFNWTAADTFTYQGWFNTTDANGPLISQRDNGAGAPVLDIMIGYDGAKSSAVAGAPIVLVRDDTNGQYAQVEGSTAVNDGAWHLFTVTRTGGTITLYIDGVSLGANTGAGAASTITTGAAGSFQHLGKEGNWVSTGYGGASNDARYLAGTFDEYRISKTIRADEWIATDYKTQSAPASTFTAGAETLASCSDGLVGTGEACDDGNIVSGDGCSGTCTVETGYTCTGAPSSCVTTCGDGLLAGSEACDDGNTTNGDGCSSTCTVEAVYHCTLTSPSVCAYARFDYYKDVTVNKAQVGTATAPATLTNYPILFSVTDTSLRTTTNGGRVRNASGYDIMFQGYDATTCGGPVQCQLPHEIEKYDGSTGQLIAWVKVPGLKTQTNATASTTFRLQVGNMAISTPSSAAGAAWDSSFKGVWHLNQSPTTTMTDSTSNANDGTGTALTSTAAEVGSGVSTDGSTSFMSFNSGTSFNTPSGGSFTYSTWLNTSDTYGGIISLRNAGNSNSVMDLMVGFDGSMNSAGTLLALVRDDTGTFGEVPGGTINTGVWHLVTVTRSGSTVTLYVDAASKGAQSDSGVALTSDTRNLGREGYWTVNSPGYTTVGNEYLAATLDEVRASSTARSLDWITTDYNCQSSPATCITYTTGTAGEVPTDGHTGVSLSSFDAAASCTGTAVTWETTYEIDTLGFNVYRAAPDGARVKLNATLITGAGLTGGGPHRYELLDPGPADGGRSYELETVHLDLDSTWDGPVRASGGCAAPAPSTWSAGSGRGTGSAATPVAGPREEAASNAPEPLGGCALAAHGDATPLALASGWLALVLARRRRRR